MAGVADESTTFGRRQQCIDVLCGYLRLPYDPDRGNRHLTEETRRTEPDIKNTQHTHHYRQNDREVRQTIVRVITAHLLNNADINWSPHNFDFTGVLFEDANFQRCPVPWRAHSFAGATFDGEYTGFAEATFSGETRFIGATFTSNETQFAGATFGGATHFDRALFGGEHTSFAMATLKGETTFDEAKFTSSVATFGEANFSGDTTFVGVTLTVP